MKAKNKEGFTLLEILVVLVIMALLMGITFRLTNSVKSAREVSDTMKKIQNLNAAISEYHAEYGIYPPVKMAVDNDGRTSECDKYPGSEIAYSLPDVTTINGFEHKLGLVSYLVDRTDIWGNGQLTLGSIYKNASEAFLKDVFGPDSEWSEHGKGLSDEGGMATDLNDLLAPSRRDRNFIRKIRPFVRAAVTDYGCHDPTKKDKLHYKFSAVDAWERDLVYICPPPYSSFSLFSLGRDGRCVASDPLNRDAECPKCGELHNKDNIYAGVDDND